MIKHVKRLWRYYLALLMLSIILFLPISWVYHFFRVSFGNEAALISLTITTMAVMVFGIRGAVHTHRIIKDLRKEMPCAGHPVSQREKNVPLLFRIFKINCPKQKGTMTETGKTSNEADLSPQQFMVFSGKRRGKQPRFPEEKIRRVVLKWESRDPSFSVLTLEEFLAQEFGSGPDGILLMAPTTFYDWRRRILKEIEFHAHK